MAKHCSIRKAYYEFIYIFDCDISVSGCFNDLWYLTMHNWLMWVVSKILCSLFTILLLQRGTGHGRRHMRRLFVCVFSLVLDVKVWIFLTIWNWVCWCFCKGVFHWSGEAIVQEACCATIGYWIGSTGWFAFLFFLSVFLGLWKLTSQLRSNNV